ncbi:MarP family serine protease [Lysinimonas soli]|uniref:MarP family serine protease n=1 Tax=Lysinimonas soli TaxID=1074233 RepID=A0ABW0NQ06_9MICO
MLPARLLDVLLVLVLLVYLGEGWRSGFIRSLSAILGLVVGAVAAFFAIPVVGTIVPDPFWRTFLVVSVAVALIILGSMAGAGIGRLIRGRIDRTALRPLDRVGGAFANLVVGALITALIAGSVASLGVPVLTRAVSGSWVLQTIDTITPEPVTAALARLRSTVLAQGLPVISGGFSGITKSPGIPQVKTDTAALASASQSVVRINGTAYACGQNQSGSGFVIAPNRIVTNAHVVAGVQQPVVQASNGQTLDGRIVYFDPNNDLAVIAVSGLGEPALTLSDPLAAGDKGVVDGYPYGGPFTSGAAQVLARSNENVENIYSSGRSVRELYTLAAQIEPGNSGGPLLAENGRIAGIVFAKSSTDATLGYAMTDTLLSPLVRQAPGLSAAISSGPCVKG